jgi:hypothetical protein
MHASEPDLPAWQARSRLNLTSGMNDHMTDPQMQSALARLAANRKLALKNAEQLLAESSLPS